jgi:hypothetical protein
MKICPVGAELLHADGRIDRQTDMTKLIVAFRNFANAPKNICDIFGPQASFRTARHREFVPAFPPPLSSALVKTSPNILDSNVEVYNYKVNHENYVFVGSKKHKQTKFSHLHD